MHKCVCVHFLGMQKKFGGQVRGARWGPYLHLQTFISWLLIILS